MRQGEVYWLALAGSEPRGRRPVVVVQDDRYNRSPIATTVVAAITSTLKLAGAPGNVRLRKGEANLPRPCVVNVTQLRTVDRSRLRDRVGALGPGRLRQVREGLALVLGCDRIHEEPPV